MERRNRHNDIRELSKLQSALFMAGGILMVIGTGCYVFMFQQLQAGLVFLTGAVLFSVMQAMQTYHGNNLSIKRLKNIMNIADLLFVLSGVLMIDKVNNFMRPMFSNQETYIQYVYNKWIVLLLIAVILEVYTVHRISNELAKADKDKG